MLKCRQRPPPIDYSWLCSSTNLPIHLFYPTSFEGQHVGPSETKIQPQCTPSPLHQTAIQRLSNSLYAPINYPERPPTITGRCRQNALGGRFHQFANFPDMVGHAKLHGWCHADHFMHPAKIVVGHEQADRSFVIFQLLRKAVRQAGEASLLHS